MFSSQCCFYSQDLSAVRLPANRRSWWNPFRAIAALAFIFLDVSLHPGWLDAESSRSTRTKKKVKKTSWWFFMCVVIMRRCANWPFYFVQKCVGNFLIKPGPTAPVGTLELFRYSEAATVVCETRQQKLFSVLTTAYLHGYLWISHANQFRLERNWSSESHLCVEAVMIQCHLGVAGWEFHGQASGHPSTKVGFLPEFQDAPLLFLGFFWNSSRSRKVPFCCLFG